MLSYRLAEWLVPKLQAHCISCLRICAALGKERATERPADSRRDFGWLRRPIHLKIILSISR